MKEKIIAAIKLRFPNVNLSKPRLAALAANIEKKVIDDETKIDAQIDALNELYPIAEIAKDDDKARNLESQLKKAAPPKKEDGSEDKETPEDKNNPEKKPETDNALLALLKVMQGELQALKSEKVQSTIKSKAAELLKEVPEIIWAKRALPDKEEGLEAFVADVVADFTAFNKEATEKGLTGLSAPKAGEKTDPSKAKQASKEEVDAVINSIT